MTRYNPNHAITDYFGTPMPWYVWDAMTPAARAACERDHTLDIAEYDIEVQDSYFHKLTGERPPHRKPRVI